MIELIADRLGSWLPPGIDARYVAEAVLRVMREPTEDMLNAEFDTRERRLPITNDEVVTIWQAMIDGALASAPTRHTGSEI